MPIQPLAAIHNKPYYYCLEISIASQSIHVGPNNHALNKNY